MTGDSKGRPSPTVAIPPNDYGIDDDDDDHKSNPSADDAAAEKNEKEVPSPVVTSPTAALDDGNDEDGEDAAAAAAALGPDGGARAWLQVLGSFLVFGNLWGFVFAFGSFQSYYELTLLRGSSASTIAWIGTVQTFLLVAVGVLSGPLFDRGHFRAMLVAGAVVETLAVFLVSLCSPVYWQLLLAQGVLMGLGNGLLYTPGLALVGRSFRQHRSMAMAVTTCGAPTGGVVYTLVFERLIARAGFAATVRAMGYVMLASYAIAFPLLLLRAPRVADLTVAAAAGGGSRRRSRRSRRLLDLRAFRDLPFNLYAASNFLLFLGYMVPFNFMASYGQTALGLGRDFALNVIIIAQASSIAGRLVAGGVAARAGVMAPWIACGVVSGALAVAWSGVASKAPFVAFAVLYGAFSGALIPLPPSVFPVVCPDPNLLGTRLGMAQGINSVGSLIGSPIAGALIGGAGRRGDFLGLQLFAGLVMILGGCNLVWLWVLLVRRRGKGTFI